MSECPLCRISRGEKAANVLYEDEHVICFLNEKPMTPGHSLVIPRKHYGTLYELASEDLARCSAVFQKMARRIARTMGAPGCNLVQNNGESAGQSIGHVHFHLIPRFTNDGFITSWSGDTAPPEQLEAVHRKITGDL